MRFFQHENVLSCLDILQVGWSHLWCDTETLWHCDTMTLCWCGREGGALPGAGVGDIQSCSIDCLPGKLIISLTQTINTDTAAISSSLLLLLQSVGSYQTLSLSSLASFIGPHFQYSTLSKLVGADVAMLTFINPVVLHPSPPLPLVICQFRINWISGEYRAGRGPCSLYKHWFLLLILDQSFAEISKLLPRSSFVDKNNFPSKN